MVLATQPRLMCRHFWAKGHTCELGTLLHRIGQGAIPKVPRADVVADTQDNPALQEFWNLPNVIVPVVLNRCKHNPLDSSGFYNLVYKHATHQI